MAKYSGPQYLDKNGFPIRYRPSEDHFSNYHAKEPLPQLRQSGTISPEAARKIAEVFRILLKS